MSEAFNDQDHDPNDLVDFTTAVDPLNPLMGNRTARVPRWVRDRLCRACAPVSDAGVVDLTIMRFTMDSDWDHNVEERESPDGDWVRYSDHVAALMAKANSKPGSGA